MTTEEENELICVKLLGLTKHCPGTECRDWRTQEGKCFYGTPSFADWASAGLILEALDKLAIGVEVGNFGIARDKSRWYCDIESIGPPTTVADTGPLAVRAAALEYIESR